MHVQEVSSRARWVLFFNTLAFTVCFAAWMLNGVLVTFLSPLPAISHRVEPRCGGGRKEDQVKVEPLEGEVLKCEVDRDGDSVPVVICEESSPLRAKLFTSNGELGCCCHMVE